MIIIGMVILVFLACPFIAVGIKRWSDGLDRKFIRQMQAQIPELGEEFSKRFPRTHSFNKILDELENEHGSLDAFILAKRKEAI